MKDEGIVDCGIVEVPIVDCRLQTVDCGLMYTKPEIKLKFSHHRNQEVVLIKKDNMFYTGYTSNLENRIRNFLKESYGVYPVGEISYGVNTHVSKKSLAKIKSP